MRDDFCHWPDLGLLALRSKVHLPDAHEPKGRRERKSKNRAEKREKKGDECPSFYFGTQFDSLFLRPADSTSHKHATEERLKMHHPIRMGTICQRYIEINVISMEFYIGPYGNEGQKKLTL